MNFGLKTLLVGLTVLGAAVGIMGKLLLESPETFVRVAIGAATIGPFLLALATLSWIGVRRRNYCLIAWACFLLLTPFAARLMLAALLPSGNPLRLLSTQRLINSRLPNQVNEPWVWNELEERLKAGEISQAEVDAAIQELTTYFVSTSPNGWNQPFHWQRDFVRLATQQRLISDEVFLDLCDAFVGPKPRVQPLQLIDGDDSFELVVEYGNPWSENTGLGVQLMWSVKQVSLDSTPLKIARSNRFANRWTGYCEADMSAGDHQLTIEVECAYVDSSKLTAAAANVPVEQWPASLKRWTSSVEIPLKVEAVGAK